MLEFHGLCSLLSELAGDDDFATFGFVLHDGFDDGCGGHTDWETGQEFESEIFGLGGGAKTSISDTLDLDFDTVLLVTESLLDKFGQFTDTSTVVTDDGIGFGGVDVDFGLGGEDTDFDARVSLRDEGTGVRQDVIMKNRCLRLPSRIGRRTRAIQRGKHHRQRTSSFC